jgi:hypothetical protein
MDIDLLVVCAVDAPTPAEIRGEDRPMPPPVDPKTVAFNQPFGIVSAMQDAVQIMLRENIRKDIQFYYHSVRENSGRQKPVIILNTFNTIRLDDCDKVPDKILEGYGMMRGCLWDFLTDKTGKGIYSNHRYQ